MDSGPPPPSCEGATELPRDDWSVSAHRFAIYTNWGLNEVPDNAIDGSSSSRYSSGNASFELATEADGGQAACADNATPSADCSNQPMSIDDWFLIDLGESATINQVVVDSVDEEAETVNLDYPVQLRAEISTDGESFTEVALMSAMATTTLCFEPVMARYVRLSPSIAAPSQWWSIFEVDVFAAPVDGDAGVPDAGSSPDAGPVVDAGVAADAGPLVDASE
jgi:hypothetical protein